MRRRSLRGIIASGTKKRLIVDDGLYTHGYRVVAFHIFAFDTSQPNNGCVGILATSDEGQLENYDASDNRQIAWSGYAQTDAFAPINEKSIIDPNHIIVTDLFVGATSQSASPMSYLVVVEPMNLSEQQGIIALVKERSQDAN